MTVVIDLHQLQEQLRSHLQSRQLWQTGDLLTLLAHGEAHAIFRLGVDRLVRVAVNTPNQRFGGDLGQLTAFEWTILHYLKGARLSHELLGAQLEPRDDFPYTYLITNYIAGEPLNYSRPQLRHCAETLARLHRLPLQPGYAQVQQLSPPLKQVNYPLTLFFQESQAYAQPYLEFSEADSDIVEMLKAVLAKAEARLAAESLLSEYPHQCLVHSDHTYENWVVGPERAYLVDWEWAEIGSPAGDLGHFLSPVTLCRREGYRMPATDRQFFLAAYYAALGDAALAETVRLHFAAFGAYPALRSLCWTAGYWVTANRWYAEHDGSSAIERQQRWQDSQQWFPQLWAEVMTLLEEPLP